MKLNSFLTHGTDSKTGDYLSPVERKKAFKKSMGYSSGTKRGSARDFVRPGSALARTDTENIDKFGPKLDTLTELITNLFDRRSERSRMESKYRELKRKSDEREKKNSEEQSMESSGTNFGSKFLDKTKDAAAKTVGFGLFNLLKGVLAYGILNWISKPENKESVEMMVKGLMGIFKVFSFFVGAAVNNTLGGFTKLFGGGSILERIFGFFQMIGGIFLFRRVLNPLKLIGDLKWVIKNLGNFKDLFKGLSSKNLSKVGDAVKNIFPKAASIFKKGLQSSVQRIFLKVFGKGITKFIKPIAKKVIGVVVRPIANLVKRVPIIGALLAVPINMFLGDPIDKAVVKSIGAALGSFIVGALGSIIPGAGTVLGAFAGGLLGDWLAGWLYDGVIAPLGKTIQKSMPQLSTGGIASGPEGGYKVTLHGTEAVIPVDKLAGTILDPYKTVASAVIGGTLAVLKSMGPIGSLMGPLALQMFNPFIRIFGFTASTFASGFGKGSELLIPSVSAKESEDPADYLSEKDKDEDKKPEGKQDTEDAGNVDTSGIEAASGSIVDKGAVIAKKIISNITMTKESAAAIAGNFAHESSGFIPGIREGGPFGRNSKPWPQGTVGRGYGWAQWTNSVPGDRYDKFIHSYGGDYNKIPTNEDNLKFAVSEMRTTNKLSDNFKQMTDTAAAAVWFRKNWERAGVHHDEPRISYSKGILAKMSEGGLFDQKKYELFQRRRFERDKKSSGDGRPPSKFASGGKAILEGAKKIIGMGKGQSNMCAATTRAALTSASHPSSEKRTTKGDLDSKGTAYNGRNFAASFAGSDMGTVIRNASSLTSGDIVLWKGGNGYGSGEITHVGIKGEGNDLWHHGSGPGWRKASMYTSYGGQTFAAGIRLDGTPGTTESSPDSASETGEDSGITKSSGFMGAGVTEQQLKDLMSNLGMGGGSSSPPAAPQLPPPTPSALPSMSKNFTLDKKMNAINSSMSETVIVQQGSNNFSNVTVAPLAINNFGVSDTHVLNKL